MRKSLFLSMSCTILLLAGCDHYSQQLAAMDSTSPDISQISPAAGSDMPFSGYLQSEYTHLAQYEQGQYDYKGAHYFTKKAHALSEGELVSPGSIKDFDISSDKSEELDRARDELISALKIYNVPENRYTLAMAQTRYDCWLEQEEENTPENEIITCKNEFRHSMASLAPPNGEDIRFAVPFEEGSLVLSEEARISIQRSLSFWENNQGQTNKLILRPAADTAPEKVSRQISMVRSILQYNGIPASAISVAPTSVGKDYFEIMILSLSPKEPQQPDGA